MSEDQLTVSLELVDDYEFRVTFDEKMAELLMDEPEPLGSDRGPNAARVLSAAVGNCLSASLLFCLRKSKIEVGELHTDVTTTMTRSERGRLRVASVQVAIQAGLEPDERARLDRCLEIFEDYCVVTQSVRDGLDVEVAVLDGDGTELHRSRAAGAPDG
jgi:uncharacterized OsmC-like protein